MEERSMIRFNLFFLLFVILSCYFCVTSVIFTNSLVQILKITSFRERQENVNAGFGSLDLGNAQQIFVCRTNCFHRFNFKFNQFYHILVHNLLFTQHLSCLVIITLFTQEYLSKGSLTQDIDKVVEPHISANIFIIVLIFISHLFHIQPEIWSLL